MFIVYYYFYCSHTLSVKVWNNYKLLFLLKEVSYAQQNGIHFDK